MRESRRCCRAKVSLTHFSLYTYSINYMKCFTYFLCNYCRSFFIILIFCYLNIERSVSEYEVIWHELFIILLLYPSIYLFVYVLFVYLFVCFSLSRP